MARRKTRKSRIPIDLNGDGKPDIDISLLEDVEPEPQVEPEKPKPGSLDNLIANLYKNPEKHRFIAPKITGYKLAVGTRTIEFRKSPSQKIGELITSDPWVIEQLLRHRDCGNKYYPESAKLRNFV